MHYSETCIKLTPMGLQGLSAHNLFFFYFSLEDYTSPKELLQKNFQFQQRDFKTF